MKAGIKKVAISPKEGIDLAGFGVPDRKNEGIHDELYLTVLVLEHNAAKAAIISADIIGFDTQLVKGWKASLLERFGFREEELFFNASHTHSGPQTLTHMLSIVGRPDEQYLAYLEQQLYAAFEAALGDMEETELYATVTKADIGISRRLISDGKALFAPNPEGKIDNNVVVLKFVSAGSEGTGKVKAVLFNYACHPSTVGTRLVSADYPGQARKAIEEHYGAGTTAIFLQGCCGDIKGRTVRDGRFRPGTWEDVEDFGMMLGQKVIEASERIEGLESVESLQGHESQMTRISDINVTSEICHLQLPLSKIPPKEYFENILLQKETSKMEWAEKMLRNYDSLPACRPFTIHRIALNNKLMFLGMSGEVCSGYSLHARSHAGDTILITAAYTNGTEGYIPTENMFAEGGYEPEGSYMYFSFPAPYDEAICELLLRDIC